MDSDTDVFLLELSGFHPDLNRTRLETIDYWCPDLPPITIAYAELGHVIVDIFSSLDNEAKEKIFQHIENGINSNNDSLATAVATGLIEAIVSRSDKDGSWPKILNYFLTYSREHAMRWHEY